MTIEITYKDHGEQSDELDLSTASSESSGDTFTDDNIPDTDGAILFRHFCSVFSIKLIAGALQMKTAVLLIRPSVIRLSKCNQTHGVLTEFLIKSKPMSIRI